MLGFEETKDGVLIAMFQAYHDKNSKYVFYDKSEENNKEDYNDSELRELLTLQHGKTAVRYKVNWEKLDFDSKFAMLKPPKSIKGEFIPFYPFNKAGDRNVHLISGKSGSGKSYLAKRLSHVFAKLMNVFIISPVHDANYKGQFLSIDDLVEDDSAGEEALNRKTYEEAKIKLKYRKKQGELDDDSLMALEMLVNEMKPVKAKRMLFKLTDKYKKLVEKPSLFIYDDTEAEKDLAKLDFLQTNQLLTGRHQHINMIMLRHLSNDGHKTRNILNESNIFTFFAPFQRNHRYFCEEYLQLSKNEIEAVKSMLKSNRSITVYKNENIILTGNKIITF